MKKNLMFLIFPCLFLLATAPAQQTNVRWVKWTSKDHKKIISYKKKIKKNGENLELSSKYYEIVSQVDEEFTAKLARYMDNLYNEMQKNLKYPIVAKVRPKIMIFKDKESYKNKIGNSSRGYFSWGFDEDNQWVDFTLYSFIEYPREKEFEKFYIPILNHEATHQLVRMQLGFNLNLNTFLDEGLATYYQHVVANEKKFNSRRRFERSHCFSRLKEAYKKGEIPPLKELLKINEDEWDVDNFGPITILRYGLAESFVAMLLETKKGKKEFKKIYRAMLNGSSRENFYGFKKDIDKLEKMWKKYLKDVSRY